jgi:hypothetical protein
MSKKLHITGLLSRLRSKDSHSNKSLRKSHHALEDRQRAEDKQSQGCHDRDINLDSETSPKKLAEGSDASPMRRKGRKIRSTFSTLEPLFPEMYSPKKAAVVCGSLSQTAGSPAKEEQAAPKRRGQQSKPKSMIKLELIPELEVGTDRELPDRDARGAAPVQSASHKNIFEFQSIANGRLTDSQGPAWTGEKLKEIKLF